MFVGSVLMVLVVDADHHELLVIVAAVVNPHRVNVKSRAGVYGQKRAAAAHALAIAVGAQPFAYY